MSKHSRVIAMTLAMALLCSISEASSLRFRKPSPLNNKGDIFVRTSTRDVALAVGTVGQTLSADPNSLYGLSWVNATSGVTNSGTLTSNAVIIGQGTTVVAAVTADTSTTHFFGSTATAPAFRAIGSADIASGVFDVPRGGTGQASNTKGDILVGDGTGWQKLPIGTNGQYLSSDSSQTLGLKWATPPVGGAGTPGGSSTQLQFNNASSFGGTSLLTWDSANSRLSLGPNGGLTSFDVAGNSRNVPFALTDAASITLNATQSNFFTVTLGGNRTLANPTGGKPGQKIVLIVSQDATGSRFLGFGTAYKFGTDVPSYDTSKTATTKDYIGMIFSGTTSCDIVSVSKGYM